MLLEITALVDARGLPRSAALSRVKQIVSVLERGAVVEVLVTGSDAAEVDAWATARGHEVVERSSEGLAQRLVLRRI